jgi:hypothetical protein
MKTLKSRQESYYLYKRAQGFCKFVPKKGPLQLLYFISERGTFHVAYFLFQRQLEASTLPFLYLLKSFIQSGFSLPAAIVEISASSKYLLARYFKFLLKKFSKGRKLKNALGFQNHSDWTLLFQAHLRGLRVLPVLEKIIYLKELETKIEEKIKAVKRNAYLQIFIAIAVPVVLLLTLKSNEEMNFEIIAVGLVFMVAGAWCCSKIYPFYKANSLSTVLKRLLNVFVEIQIQTLYGFDLKYSWNLLERHHSEFCQKNIFCFFVSKTQMPELEIWGVLLRSLYHRGLSVGESLDVFLRDLTGKLEREGEKYQKTLPLKINIIIMVFYLPIIFLWVYYPLLKSLRF